MGQLFIQAAVLQWERLARDSYVREIPAFRGLERLNFSCPVTIFAGENGSGKSTMLEAIAIAAGFNAEGGTWNYRFSTYDSHSELHEALKLIRGVKRPSRGYFLRAESFYNVATQEEQYFEEPELSQHYHSKSHGESFLAMAQKHFGSGGLYFLDEPEAALSPQRQLTLLLEMDAAVRAGAQFIVVTHSPILLGMPGAEILAFDDGLHPCRCEETGSWQILSMFMNHREEMLRHLLEEE